MNFIARSAVATALLTALVTASGADAALVEIRFAGTIDVLQDAANIVDDSVRIGDRMWISLIHDIDAPTSILSAFPQEKRREGAGINSPLLSYSVGSGVWQFGESAISSRVWSYQRDTCCLDSYGGDAVGANGRASANLTSRDDILPFDFETQINRTVPVTSEAHFRFDGFRTVVGFDIDSFSVTTLTAVPEPATWATMLGGFATIGGAARYRRRRMTAAFA
ncbi:MAG TPA: PEPxxWA-CTERM sorting domain-containing protein [Sphingomonas sp.]|jgi:hypothetical protein|uniref:PEPxxWA-CTERM sorting domain-containing protein n=1 Tax=Sphingomonas sp. TaxID=28214 RepID=UPI002ED88BFB